MPARKHLETSNRIGTATSSPAAGKGDEATLQRTRRGNSSGPATLSSWPRRRPEPRAKMRIDVGCSDAHIGKLANEQALPAKHDKTRTCHVTRARQNTGTPRTHIGIRYGHRRVFHDLQLRRLASHTGSKVPRAQSIGAPLTPNPTTNMVSEPLTRKARGTCSRCASAGVRSLEHLPWRWRLARERNARHAHGTCALTTTVHVDHP